MKVSRIITQAEGILIEEKKQIHKFPGTIMIVQLKPKLQLTHHREVDYFMEGTPIAGITDEQNEDDDETNTKI